jgi:hypothetical protein
MADFGSGVGRVNGAEAIGDILAGGSFVRGKANGQVAGSDGETVAVAIGGVDGQLSQTGDALRGQVQ